MFNFIINIKNFHYLIKGFIIGNILNLICLIIILHKISLEN